MERIFYFSGRAKNLLPTLDYHMNINIPKVTPPEPYEPRSATCPNHWFNMIVDGRCEECIIKGKANF